MEKWLLSGIRSRFAPLLQAAVFGSHYDWAATPRGRLALIPLFDQFPRNMHRASPHAFAYHRRCTDNPALSRTFRNTACHD